MDKELLISRIDALLAVTWEMSRMHERSSQVLQGAISVLQAVHGTDSQQLETLRNRVAAIERGERAETRVTHGIFEAARGALTNTKGELEAGFIGTLDRTITGEVLSDFVQFANAALELGGDKGKNVAAVLAAAAFEDTIRKMGARFCGIQTRDDLSNIVIALKNRL
jgi:hypothetical protein